MGTQTVHRASVPATRTGADNGRLLLTLIGGAALVVAAFLNWTRDMTGVTLSNHSLIKTEFVAQTDIVKTVGGIAVVIGLAGMFGLVDRTGWLTRLFGLLGIALFVMFAIEVYRSSQHTMQPGAWLALGGGIALLLAGFLHSGEVVRERPSRKDRRRIGAGEPDSLGTDAGPGGGTDIPEG